MSQSSIRIQLWIIFFLIISLQHLRAQDPKIKSVGIPLIITYGASDYGLSSQNFDVLVGADQRMYFANFNGLVIYDGINWTRVSLSDESSAYSLAKASSGTIYVGGVNQIGFVTTTLNGELKYHSLNDQLSESIKTNFTSWKAYSTGDQIIFATTDHLFIVDDKTKSVEVVSCPLAYWTMNVVDGTIYSHRSDSLFSWVDEKWQALRPSDLYQFPASRKVFSLALGTRDISVTYQGFFDFHTDEPISISPEVSTFLRSNYLKNVKALPGNYLAISTYNGLLITNIQGDLIHYLNEPKGLVDNLIYQVTTDNSNMMWVAANSGINKVDIYSPFSIFDERMGLSGVINDAAYHQGKLYLSSFSGIYSTEVINLQDPLLDLQFDKLAENLAWDFIKREKELISLTSANAYVIREHNYEVIDSTGAEVYWEGISLQNPEGLMLGSESGYLLHILPDQEFWKISKKSEKRFPGIHTMVQVNDSTLWVGNRVLGLYKVTYDFQNSVIVDIQHYRQEQGLPKTNGNNIFGGPDDYVFATANGIYQFNAYTDRFEKNPVFEEVVGDKNVFIWTKDSRGNIFFNAADGLFTLDNTPKGYKLRDLNKSKMEGKAAMKIEVIDSSNIILPTIDAFYHLDGTMAQKKHESFSVNFTNLYLISERDSVLYGGFGNIPSEIVLPFSKSVFRTEFAAAFYDQPEQTEYKWFLQGYDNSWSEWSQESRKDYTNIPHGEYTFKVQAKNVFGTESEIRQLSFTILPPWYQSNWAYAIYLIGFATFIWGLVKLNTRRLLLEKYRLEVLVKERTGEIRKQKEQAEKDASTISNQHEQLLQADELKNRFFVNISHELRTPLTLTMGTVDQTLKGRFGQLNHEQYANLKVSYRNSERLLKMVNNILDISKLEGGKVQLYAQEVDPRDLINKVVAFFQSKMDDKQIHLSKDLQSKALLFLDKDKVETVLINLIANAFKFTPQEGSINIKTRNLEGEDKVEMIISDSGVGIPATDLPFVFDRFYQSEHLKSGEGTGVGLALSKELVDLHQGTIRVESRLEQGTNFTLTFKTGKDHLQPNQIVDSEAYYKPISEKMPELNTSQVSPEIISNQSVDRQHVLVVEDNYEMSRFIQQILEEQYQLTFAQDGQQAISLLEQGVTFDLILTDFMMPIMNGYEMAMEIKKQNEWALIPMVFLTARAQEQDKIDLLNIGVDDYLYKPFNEDELKARINNLLKAKTQRAEYWIEKTIDPRDIEWKEFPSKLKLDIDEYLQQHITEDISGKDLAEITGQSERSLYRKVKANTGLTLNQYIKEFKLRKARALLENKQVMTVSEAANAVGFNYLHNFTNNFKERFGKLPSEYLD